MADKNKIDITDMSFKELLKILSENPNVPVSCGVALKVMERFEENLVETYGLKPVK